MTVTADLTIIGMILTVSTAIVGLIWFFVRFNNRLTIVETKGLNKKDQEEINNRLTVLETKLPNKVDKNELLEALQKLFERFEQKIELEISKIKN